GFSIVKKADASSIQLLEAVSQGSLFPSARLLLYNRNSLAEPMTELAFANVTTTSIRSAGSDSGDPTEEVTFTAASGPAALFLQLPGVLGGRKTPGHAGLIKVLSFTIDAQSNALSVVKDSARTKPTLGEVVAEATLFSSASLFLYNIVDPKGPPDGTVTFEKVLAETFSISPGADGPTERIGFLFLDLITPEATCMPGNTLCNLTSMTVTAYKSPGYAGSRLEFGFVDPLLSGAGAASPAWTAYGQVDGLYPDFPTTIAATLDGAGRPVRLGRVGIGRGSGTEWIWDAGCGAPCFPRRQYLGQTLPAWDGDVGHVSTQSFQIVPVPHDGWAHSRFPTSGYDLSPADRPQVPDASCVDNAPAPSIPSDPGCGGACTRTQATCSDVMQGGGLTRVLILPPGKGHVTIETLGDVTPPVTFYIQFPYEQPDIGGCGDKGRCRSVYPPAQNTFILTVN
ncbi:MAG TPA: type VI secretion system tube protein Hcp, partial [Thermodesulfobacteriota bacterium]|nr:type VI secretion system tube protein Hcp [Thermodesulfobacteriota bacterium]